MDSLGFLQDLPSKRDKGNWVLLLQCREKREGSLVMVWSLGRFARERGRVREKRRRK
jgi:hypothetical protein